MIDRNGSTRIQGPLGRLGVLLVLATLLGIAIPHASAEPLDVDSEIPAPAGEREADALGGDWIRSEARGTTEHLDADQLANSDRQRRLVQEIASKQFGDQLDRTKADLQTIQRILDEKLLGSNPDDMLQALGVVLGDVLVEQAGYRWIRFADEKGRSRALRSRDGKTVAFPVTALSRIVAMKHRPDVTGVYAQLAAMGGAKKSP